MAPRDGDTEPTGGNANAAGEDDTAVESRGTNRLDRRELLATLGATAGMGAFAGCSGVSDIVETVGEGAEAATREFGPPRTAGLSDDVIRALGPPEPETTEYTVEENRTVDDQEYFITEHSVLQTYGTASTVRYPICVLSMPRSIVDGVTTNPAADAEFEPFVWGEHGRQVFEAMGMDISPYERSGTGLDLAPDTFIDISDDGSSTPLREYKLTLTADDGTTFELSFVFATEYTVRDDPSTEDESLYGVILLGTGMLSEGSVPEARRERMYDLIHRAAPGVVFNPVWSAPDFDVGIEDPRLVQTVEDTVVDGIGLELADPPLVEGEHVAPVFGLSGFGDLPWYLRTTIETEGGPVSTGSSDGAAPANRTAFDIRKADAGGIRRRDRDPPAAFDVATRESPWNPGLEAAGEWSLETPVFELTSAHSALSVELMTPVGQTLDETRLEKGSDFETVDSQFVRVGFIPIRDQDKGGNYGNEPRGFAPDYERTVDASVEYLHRVFPGGIVAYRHDDVFWGHKKGVFGGGLNRDFKKARKQLEKAAAGNLNSGQNLPQGGEVMTRGNVPSGAQELTANGFDVCVVIVPDGYFSYHKNNDNTVGLCLDLPSMAVGAKDLDGQEALGNGMPATVGTVAHEIGHYIKEEPFDRPDGPEGPGTYPLAQRDFSAADPRSTGGTAVGGGSYDLDHARHRGSDVDDDGDTDGPGIVSRGYDLTGGTFRTVNGYGFDGSDFVLRLPLDLNPGEDDHPRNDDVNRGDGRYDPDPRDNAPGYDEVLGTRRYPSYMSYSDPAWADSRMHEVVIDSDYRRDKWDDSGPIFDATGAVDDDGEVQLVSVDAFQGRPLVDSWDENREALDSARPVEVALETPNGEVVASRTVLDKRLANRHIQTVVETVDLRVEFPMDTATVSIQREDAQTEINPITSVLRDVVGRLPDEGFAGDAEEVRSQAGSVIDEVAEEMAEQQFGAAKSTLQDAFMPIARQDVRAEYDAVTDEPTSEVVVDYTERMIARLEALADATQDDQQEEDDDEDEQESSDCGSLTASYDRFDASGTGIIADFDYPAAADQVSVGQPGEESVTVIGILDNDRSVTVRYTQSTDDPSYDSGFFEQVTTVEFGGSTQPVYREFDSEKARRLGVVVPYDGQEFVVTVEVGIDQDDPLADVPEACGQAANAAARDIIESLEPNTDATP